MSERQGRNTRVNQRAEEATVDLIDRRLTKAIAHPLRLQILALANQRTISPSEYSEEMGAPLSTVAYHFRKLLELGFLELVEEVPKRGSKEHRYRGCRRGVVSDANWQELGKATQAGVRIAGFQDLIARCTQAVNAGTFDARDDAIFYWAGGGVDETGWKEFTEASRQLIERVKEIEDASAERSSDGGMKCFPTTFAIAAFESPPDGRRRR
ncbi:MAG TPA: winged helix-turn-helix domain-containing protein [Solirubrobacterales bacterium]|nr:winged helix-turn-helix domain-containing protein [Solirubrobacterales bacterium]